jgi:hypothetical protein
MNQDLNRQEPADRTSSSLPQAGVAKGELIPKGAG